MARSKRDLFMSFWIPVDKRRPPNDNTKILYYNPDYDRIGETFGQIFNIWMDQIKDPAFVAKIKADPLARYLDGYLSTHWMLRYKPEE